MKRDGAMEIRVKKLRPDAKLPAFAHPGDAGMDLFAPEEVTLQPGERVKIGTGIAVEIPHGYVGLIWDKSSIAATHCLKHLGGVMDAGYRGEYIVTLINLSTTPYTIEKHHKIAQLLIQKVEHPNIIEAEELSDSSRGAGAFGSTGK